MIYESKGSIDYEEQGNGPTVVLAPGSCSTGAAWRPVISEWNGSFRCVTTSLLGYGGTTERRHSADTAIHHEAAMLEAVIRMAGGPVHLVGHSFGGLVGLAVALRRQVQLTSLTILEAPVPTILPDHGEHRLYQSFVRMFDAYFADFVGGNREAIAAMVDFYGGPGTYASWPQRVRDYACQTTRTNLLDWKSAFGFAPTHAALATLDLPTLVCIGQKSHPAVKCANDLLSIDVSGTRALELENAAHFMISTHATETSRVIARHILSVETLRAAA